MRKSVWLVIGAILLSGAGPAAPRNPIDHMTVYSLGWEDMYAVSMSPRRIFESSEAEVRDIDDPELVRQIREHTARIERRDGRDQGPIDGRLLCCLYREDGQADVLVFSRLRMEYNGLVYDTDTDLLRLVATTQSELYRETVERWITVLKNGEEK